MTDPIIQQTKQHMEKGLEAFQREISRLRTGRASLAILDEVRVDYYGQMVPLNQVATLGVPESQLITVSPWERQMISVIEKAIEKANIGLTPANDGKVIRLPIPPLTEERRRDLVKMIKHYAEESRVAIRHARKEAMDNFKKREKESTLTEDEHKKLANEIQKLTDEYVARVDQVFHNKEKEVMQVG